MKPLHLLHARAARPQVRLPPARARRVPFAAGVAAALLCLTSALFAARALPPLSAAPQRAGPGAEHPITGQFQRHALNALLVPLLDDDEPPRWTDAGLNFFCGPGTRVEVNGQPLVPGAALPTTPFTVRWHIDRCWPLDYAAFELSGSVELQVSPVDTGLAATVSAQRLRIATRKGSGSLQAPFAAHMAMGDRPMRSAP